MSNLLSELEIIDGDTAYLISIYDEAIHNAVGVLSELNTTDKSSIVNAINEVLSTLNTDVININQLLDGISSEIGTLSNLTTTDKTNLVNAINEVKTGVTNNSTKIGTLSSLNTDDKTSLVNAINEVLSRASNFCVNVKDFGAVGDGVTNDYNAINNAILYATQHDASIIYFPRGKYNCGSGTFDIDASKIAFLGTGASVLISSGLTGGDAFITITSPLSLEQYDFPRTPLIGITIVGNYFNDVTQTTGVYGIKMGTDSTFVAPHTMLYNVVIRGFGIGLGLTSAYKTSYINVSIIACDIGIYIPTVGIQQAVPCNFYTIYVECCNTGIYGLSGGFNNLSFFGGAFEYNRSVHNCYTKLVFVGVRFEYDCKASCDAQLNVRPVFQGSALSGSSTVIKYIGCFFLGLNNFAENVQYWISNPYKASAYNISPFYIVGGNKVSLEMVDCEIADVNVPSGVYYISSDKFFGTGNYIHDNAIQAIVNPANVVTETDGFIGNDYVAPDA